jgi:hypothetical protein
MQLQAGKQMEKLNDPNSSNSSKYFSNTHHSSKCCEQRHRFDTAQACAVNNDLASTPNKQVL